MLANGETCDVQFNKDTGKVIEECKLRVVYVNPQSGSANAEESFKQSSDTSMVSSFKNYSQFILRENLLFCKLMPFDSIHIIHSINTKLLVRAVNESNCS